MARAIEFPLRGDEPDREALAALVEAAKASRAATTRTGAVWLAVRSYLADRARIDEQARTIHELQAELMTIKAALRDREAARQECADQDALLARLAGEAELLEV